MYSADVEEYSILIEYMEKFQDGGWDHPLLHESADQMSNHPEIFKFIWLHKQFSGLHDTVLYVDKYGLTAKQRLSHCLYDIQNQINSRSNPKDKDMKELIKWCYKNLGVKSCQRERNQSGS